MGTSPSKKSLRNKYKGSTNTVEEIETNEMRAEDCKIKLLNDMFCQPVTNVYKSDQCVDLMNHLLTLSLDPLSISDISHIVDNDNCAKFFHSYVLIVTENCDDMLANISQRQYLNFIRLVMSLWNMSDKFDSLCARMTTFDIHTCLIRLIGRMKVTPALLGSKKLRNIVLSVLGILHNINIKLHKTRSKYREEHLVQFLKPLADLETTKEFIGLKTAALLLLALLVNEDENSGLNANDEHIIYILNILKQTLDSGVLYSTYYGYHSLEILTSLRHIASPDNNKRSLINNGVLHQIEMVLKLENNEDHLKVIVAALELLWSLSFSKECIQILNEDNCDLKHLIKKLSTDDHPGVALSAQGLIWNMNAPGNNNILNEGKIVNPHGHVMISYQHRTQDVMVKIKDKLSFSGYKVWMDVDHMCGSFLDAMAEGIQGAAVLILGVCQAFKMSPHCRQEVKYAYLLGIRLLPIMLEPGYSMDGWLGLTCASIIYTEFIDPTEFDTNMDKVQHQLGNLGKMSPTNGDRADGSYYRKLSGACTPKCSQDETQISEDNVFLTVMAGESCTPNRMNKESNLNSICCSKNSLNVSCSNLSRYQVLEWTLEQCQSWLAKHSLDTERIGYPLSHFDGALLFELAEMRLTAPESYFRTLKEELKLNFIDKLHLCHALRRLDDLR